MPGVRIHHIDLRNCTLLVEHPGEIKKLFRTKYKGRVAKDYHIKLDNEGNCIVSETVWTRLQEAGVKDFIVLNTVEDPPAQVVGINMHAPEKRSFYKEIDGIIREIREGKRNG